MMIIYDFAKKKERIKLDVGNKHFKRDILMYNLIAYTMK